MVQPMLGSRRQVLVLQPDSASKYTVQQLVQQKWEPVNKNTYEVMNSVLYKIKSFCKFRAVVIRGNSNSRKNRFWWWWLFLIKQTGFSFWCQGPPALTTTTATILHTEHVRKLPLPSRSCHCALIKLTKIPAPCTCWWQFWILRETNRSSNI